MPQSLDRMLLYIILSTKNRSPFLTESVRTSLNPPFTTVARKRSGPCPPVKVTAELVETPRTLSTKWRQTLSPELNIFAGPRGYAFFSVRPTPQNALIACFDRQIDHRQKTTFRNEYRAFLKQFYISYEERHAWD